MSIKNWEHFFKPEVRSSGRTLFLQGKVSLSQPSDTEIALFIRASTSFKVSFKSKSVSSSLVLVDCNCPAGKKNLFCKHIWAGLLAAEEKNSDFLDGKIEIEKKVFVSETFEKVKSTKTPLSESRATTQAAFKEKQAQYRKEQYQKQKQRLKDLKKSKKEIHIEPEFPEDVEKALNYFSQNGFELRKTLKKDIINSAKKKLARIFHPDLGGSHEEILALNEYTDILIDFSNIKN